MKVKKKMHGASGFDFFRVAWRAHDHLPSSGAFGSKTDWKRARRTRSVPFNQTSGMNPRSTSDSTESSVGRTSAHGWIAVSPSQIAQSLERAQAREQAVRMEVVEFPEPDRDFRFAGRQAHFRRDAGQYIVEIVAVHHHRLALPSRAAAEIAGHQDVEWRIRPGLGQIFGLLRQVDKHGCE